MLSGRKVERVENDFTPQIIRNYSEYTATIIETPAQSSIVALYFDFGTGFEENNMELKKTFGQATPTQISSIEKRYNVTLPADYKEFLLANNGGTCGYKYYFILDEHSPDTEITLDLFYGIDVVRQASIATYMDMFLDDLLPNTLVIATDLMGGEIVLITDSPDYGVYYWDDAYELDGSDDDTNTYYICDTFTDFVKILTTGIAGE